MTRFIRIHRISSPASLSRLLALLCLLCLETVPAVGQTQKKDSSKTTIQILHSEYGEYIQGEDGNAVHKLINAVKLRHGSDTLYCDSAFFYQISNSVEAFGNVAIYQADGTAAFADYMRYTGFNKKVFMRGDHDEVQLLDPDNNSLWSREIDYDLKTKIGSYRHGGTLQNDATILTSETGTYNLKTKDARFKKNVEVSDPEYHVISSDLGYNTDSKVVTFFGPSVVTNDKSIFQTSKGTYDTKRKKSHFVSRSSLLNEAQYIEADTLDYDQTTGLAAAIGNVIAIDTHKKFTLYCGVARYNEITHELHANEHPIMKMQRDNDSLFIRFDSFYSAPVPIADDSLTAQESLQKTADVLHQLSGSQTQPPDSAQNNAPLSTPETTKPPPPDSTQMTPPTSPPLGDTTTIETHSAPPTLSPDDGDTLNSRPQRQPAPPADDENPGAVTLEQTDTTTAADSAAPADSFVGSGAAATGYRLRNQVSLDSAGTHVAGRPPGADSNAPRYFVGYHHVLIYSDSLQGKCDSIRYSETDSLLRMYLEPVLWANKSQITGAVILLKMDSSKIKELQVPKDGIMISRTGPEIAGMYNQIQGNTLHAFFIDNKIDSLVAQPDAYSIYYIQDEADAYVGASEAESEVIQILFENEEIDKIYYRQDFIQKTTPMEKVVPDALHLSRFQWREDEKPKSLDQFLNGNALPEPQLLLSEP